MKYSEIASRCAIYLPQAPKALIVDYLKRSTIDLCKAANVLIQTQTVELAEDDASFNLTADAGFTPLRLVDIEDWTVNRDYKQVNPFQVAAYKKRSETVTLTYTVAVEPVWDADSIDVPQELELYHDALFSRAIQYLADIKGKPFSDPNLAAIHAGLWSGYTADAKRNAAMGHHQGNRIVNFRRFT